MGRGNGDREETQPRHRQAKSPSTLIAQLQNGQGAQERQQGQRGEPQAQRQARERRPALLAQRPAAPEKDRGHLPRLDKAQQSGQGTAEQTDNQAGDHRRDWFETATPNEQENQTRGDRAARDGDKIPAETEKARRRDCGHRQRHPRASLNTERRR